MTNKELIHSDFQIKEVEAVVRRDAFTTIHVHVPPYETNILRNLFGRENVTVFERQSKTTITPEQEYDRLPVREEPFRLPRHRSGVHHPVIHQRFLAHAD